MGRSRSARRALSCQFIGLLQRQELYACPSIRVERMAASTFTTCGRTGLKSAISAGPTLVASMTADLYAAYPEGEVFAFDGNNWEHLGNPIGTLKNAINFTHKAPTKANGLSAPGPWEGGRKRGGKWEDLGRLGDSTEVVGLTLYNGSLYAGAIPRAEVFRSTVQQMGVDSQAFRSARLRC